MSQVLIQQYLNRLADLRRVSGTHREMVVRDAFQDLLKGWARPLDLVFSPEFDFLTPRNERRSVDGALLYQLRVPLGFWEAKDEDDDLDKEIEKKFRRGYPTTNIIFEDSTQAILIQNAKEVMRCPVEDVNSLQQLLELFFSYQPPEIAGFRKAVDQFKTDIPAVLGALRKMIEKAEHDMPAFAKAAREFLTHARDVINPSLTEADVREMLIQHVLTEQVFRRVFPDTNYHEDNNVARELNKLESTFFTGNTKSRTLKALQPYYAAIGAAAAQISNHHEKQTFLKVIYENFYKVYNAKAADRLGVVYTPNEIVRFMIESADWLCDKHFNRNLIDKDVEILDPAAGTGTFICELLEHFRGQKQKLKFKYAHELHANEVAILPYYVANLNIEATYEALTGEYVEFPSLCFVDTLDNVGLHTAATGTTGDIFGSVTEENVARIKRQNSRKISVIIGNPPYNAWQENFNFRNPNRPYKQIDERIKATYQFAGTARNQIALFDMYVRFLRWATDRLDENGILALITNRNFISTNTFDGFRKIAAEEFCEIWIVDLGGDVRANPKLSGTTHNVFGIQTGVAISFMVRRQKKTGCNIFYTRRPELETAEEKRSWLGTTSVRDAEFTEIRPDSKYSWTDQGKADFVGLIPLIDQDVKAAKSARNQRAIFRLFSPGLKSQRDEWVYDLDRKVLERKMNFFVNRYESVRTGAGKPELLDIKWDHELESYARRQIPKSYSDRAVTIALYRPFSKQYLYFDRHFNARQYKTSRMFGDGHLSNRVIAFSDRGARAPFSVLGAAAVPELHLCASTDGFQVAPLLDYDEGINAPVENITDWALDQFKKHYQPGRGRKEHPITKEAIFHYVYGVLHDPVYREKYALNLKREFPRIPFYPEFWRWADWGKNLMELHTGYEQVEPWPLQRKDAPDDSSAPTKRRKREARASDFSAATSSAAMPPRPILKADKPAGQILLDSVTTLSGVPPEAWNYRLGNRTALEWILDQYKEKKPKDPTIREKFNSYRFADYKEKVIDLLMRVTRVSVETQAITEAMKHVRH